MDIIIARIVSPFYLEPHCFDPTVQTLLVTPKIWFCCNCLMKQITLAKYTC